MVTQGTHTHAQNSVAKKPETKKFVAWSLMISQNSPIRFRKFDSCAQLFKHYVT